MMRGGKAELQAFDSILAQEKARREWRALPS